MKQLSLYAIANFFCVLFCTTALWAQENTDHTTMPDVPGSGSMSTKPGMTNNLKPNTGSSLDGISNISPCAIKPDLHITTFTTGTVVSGAIEGSGMYQTRRYTIHFTATVKNSGGATAGVCKLESQFSQATQNNYFWGGYYNVGSLSPGATQNIVGTITIRIPASHTHTDVRLFIDSPAGEEFLPAYHKVNECNENNNLSTVLKVKVK